LLHNTNDAHDVQRVMEIATNNLVPVIQIYGHRVQNDAHRQRCRCNDVIDDIPRLVEEDKWICDGIVIHEN